MNVLVIGSGGREHALTWKIAQSSHLRNMFIAPGNAGTAQIGTNLDIDPMDFDGIKAAVLENEIEIIVVGPEGPLVAGISDYFTADPELKGVTVIGPNKHAAQLEGSKEFAKEFMVRHNIPTAKYKSFTRKNLNDAEAFLNTLKPPFVLKADGLAAGKGVLIIEDLQEALNELSSMVKDSKFGAAGNKVVIEEFLKGVEVSMFVISDGASFKLLPEAKDYKRIGEGDTGLNTGGMGAISPVPFVNQEFMEKVKNQIIIPTVKGLKADGIHYQGFIFFGLIKVAGDPYVIEYNCRLGDPETEVILPRIKSDLLHFFEGIASNTLSECDIEFDERTAATVIAASGGYPEKYEKGKRIHGLPQVKNAIVFHAGTSLKDGNVVTAGGRVLAVTAVGADLEDTLEKSYKAIQEIGFDQMYYRKDIGADLKKTTTKA
jgi:phosphoribosylamine---glycine ligase